MKTLEGRHILIIGGSRGLGAEAARECASRGASVSLTYNSGAQAAKDLCGEIVKKGGRALAYKAEARSEEALKNAVSRAVESLGPLNGLVVSAGVFEHALIASMKLDFWDRVIGINLTGTFLAVKSCVPYLKQSGGGSIVIYTSTAGQRGAGGGASAYATSKAGQIIFMKSAAKEFGPDKIRVNCIAPAWTETDMAKPHLDQLGREKVVQGFPLGRIGLPADVAKATAFLLGDDAGFVTGATLTVDGGMDMLG